MDAIVYSCTKVLMQYTYQTVDSNFAKDSISVVTKISLLAESKTFLDAIYSSKSLFSFIVGRKRI